jgi:hypothetical protein
MYNAASSGPNESAIYYDGSPEVTKYSAGSRSWRTNNPGLLPANEITWPYGAIGEALGVAVFRDPDAGRRALCGYLAHEKNAGRTVDDLLRGFLPTRYTPPPRETDPATGEPLPWLEPETGLDLEQPLGGGQIPQLAELIERRLGYHPGVITKEPLDTGTLNEAARVVDTCPENVLINGRSAVHRGSGGQVCTIDICETPSGKGCKPRTYGNVAKSSDAAKTASSVFVNGHPVCHKDSIFSRSSGDEAGRCGGVQSGTIKGKAEFLTGSPNVFIEGVPAARQFDLMVSNNRNTSLAPLQQPGGARPPFLDTLGALGREPTPAPWRIDWRILGGQVSQLAGRWRLSRGPGLETTEAEPDPGQPPAGTELNPHLETLAGERAVEAPGYWETGLELPEEGACDYDLRLAEADPWGSGPSVYDIPFRDYGPDGRSGKASRNRSTEAEPTGEEVAVPVVIGLYASPERDPQKLSLPWLGPGELTTKARHDSAHNQGWLYVYLDGFLWRELEVRGPTEDPTDKGGLHGYADVNLESHMGKDLRPATVEQVNHLLLPQKIAGRAVKVEIAYSRVQWSWSRLVGYGGIHPADPRWERNAPVCLPQKEWPEAAQRRAQRFQRVDLAGDGENWPAQPGDTKQAGRYGVDDIVNGLGDTDFAGFLDAHEHQGLPVLLLDDPLGWARDKAYAYQSAWREMEEYINDLSNPDHTEEKKKQFPFAPWFDSAVLANRYFFVEHPETEAEGLQLDAGDSQGKPLKRAKDQRVEWRKKLNLGDIQTALGTKHRVTLREKIKTTKQKLVAILDNSNPELDRLIAVLDDWFALPGEPKGPLMVVDHDRVPHYGDAFVVVEQLIAKLGDHECTLDHHLETEPPSENELHQLAKNDPGATLLIDLISQGHPLYARMVPAGECTPGDESNESSQPQVAAGNRPGPYDPQFSADKLLIVGRRAAQSISGWIEHYAGVAASKFEVQKSIVGFVSKSQLMPEMVKYKMPLTAFLENQIPEGYKLIKALPLKIDQPIKRSDALKFDGGEIKLSPNKSANLDLYTPDGKHFASTTLEAFKQSRGFSSRYWKRIRHGTKTWYEHTVEVWLTRQIKGAPAFAKQIVDKGAWTKAVLPLVVMLEAWNLQSAYRVLWKQVEEGDVKKRVLVDLAGAIADSAALAASVNQTRHQLAHRAAEQLAGKQLPPSTQHLGAIRWARGLGIAAGVYSAGLSFYDMLRNVEEGDDAAIAHGVMGAGFVLSTASLLIQAYEVGGVIGSLAGPLGWIGLGVIFAGAALLAWVFTEDTPLEEWLANGPFSHKPDLNLTHPRGRNRRHASEHARYTADDGSQLSLDKDNRILRIGDINHSLTLADDGSIYQACDNGDRKPIGHIGEPLDLDRLADRSQRFAGFNENDEVDSKFHIWKVNPRSAYDSLLSAIYTPTPVLRLVKYTAREPWRAVLTVHIPQYIDNRSLLTIELLQTNHSNVYLPVYKEIHTITPDNGSGPRSITISQPLEDQYGGKIKAKIQLDLHGDKKVVLPMPEPSWSEADELRRQQRLTEKRIVPVGKIEVIGEKAKVDSGATDETPPASSTERFLEKYAGPPPSQFKAL